MTSALLNLTGNSNNFATFSSLAKMMLLQRKLRLSGRDLKVLLHIRSQLWS